MVHEDQRASDGPGALLLLMVKEDLLVLGSREHPHPTLDGGGATAKVRPGPLGGPVPCGVALLPEGAAVGLASGAPGPEQPPLQQLVCPQD